MSEVVGGPFYTVPWSPGMQECQMPGEIWVKLAARAEELRQLDAPPRVLRQAITMRAIDGVSFGSPLDQLVCYLGVLAPRPKPTNVDCVTTDFRGA